MAGHLDCVRANYATPHFHQLINSITLPFVPSPTAQEVFLAVVGLWQRLVCGHPGRALALARMPDVLAKLEGVARLLALKQDGDRKYLLKLEQQKGSDVSARQATKALLATSRQLKALRAVLGATGASSEGQGGAGGVSEEPLHLGKNTLVRAVLRQQK